MPPCLTLVVSSLVVGIVLVLSLRRPFTAPSVRALAKQLRKHPDQTLSIATTFPTPPLPVGASKEK